MLPAAAGSLAVAVGVDLVAPVGGLGSAVVGWVDRVAYPLVLASLVGCPVLAVVPPLADSRARGGLKGWA